MINTKIVKALTWKQPFASLMLKGKIETRTWDTKYRGLVLICAGMQNYDGKQIIDICGMPQYIRMIDLIDFPYLLQSRGYAIAIGTLVDSRPMQPTDEDACFVKYDPNLWCHIYDDVKEIVPFKWKGKQGWATLTYDQMEQIIIK